MGTTFKLSDALERRFVGTAPGPPNGHARKGSTRVQERCLRDLSSYLSTTWLGTPRSICSMAKFGPNEHPIQPVYSSRL